jgi:hypothetical protein
MNTQDQADLLATILDGEDDVVAANRQVMEVLEIMDANTLAGLKVAVQQLLRLVEVEVSNRR